MSSRQYSVFLLFACVAVISLAAAIRIHQTMAPQRQQPSPLTIQPAAAPLEPEASFFESQTISNPNPASAPVAPPAPSIPGRVADDGITAKAYLVGNVLTGQVYMQHDSTTVLPFASMSKLVTAFVATDQLAATTSILITPAEAAAPPDGSGIGAGERYSMQELLLPMLLDSSNIAAEAIAGSGDRAHFLELMSSYAWEIGMPSTFFADPSGVSPKNVSDAQDLFALAKYLFKYRPDILAITRTAHTSFATTTDHGAHSIDSIHPFVTDPRFIGGKTGHTPEAGDTMMTILRIDNQPIAFIVLGSDSGMRGPDTDILISKVEKVLQ